MIIVKFNVEFCANYPIKKGPIFKSEIRRLQKTVQLAYVPVVGMSFGNDTVEFIMGHYDKVDEVTIYLKTKRMQINEMDYTEEDFTGIIDDYFKSGWRPLSQSI